MPSLLYTDEDIRQIYARNADAVYRLCFSFMKNRADTEDAVQDTFLRMVSKKPTFASEKHERAWLIVTASNICKDVLKSCWRKRESIDDQTIVSEDFIDDGGVTNAILRLPADYKTVVYLYYYEGYRTPEIAEMLRLSTSTVRSRLTHARRMLKIMLGGDME